MISKNNYNDLLIDLDKRLSGVRDKIKVRCCGGFVALLVFNTREETNDIDAIFNNKFEEDLVLRASEGVLNKSGWINGDSSSHNFDTNSDIVLFSGENLEITSVSVEELLFDRILRPKGVKDINDSVGMLLYLSEDESLKQTDVINKIFSKKEIKDKFDKDKINIFSERFSALWEAAFNDNKDDLVRTYPLSVLENNADKLKIKSNKKRRAM